MAAWLCPCSVKHNCSTFLLCGLHLSWCDVVSLQLTVQPEGLGSSNMDKFPATLHFSAGFLLSSYSSLACGFKVFVSIMFNDSLSKWEKKLETFAHVTEEMVADL